MFILGALFIGFEGAACSRPLHLGPALAVRISSGTSKEPGPSPKVARQTIRHRATASAKTCVYTDPQKHQLYFGSETAYQRYRAKAAQTMVKEPQQSSQQSMSPSDWEMYGYLHGISP